MSKVIRTAAIVVGAVALVATGVGALAGTAVGASLLGASAATVASVAGTVASVATLAAAGLSIAATVIGNGAAKPPLLGGSATKFTADKDAGVPLVIGRTAFAGNVIYRRTHNATGSSLPDLQTFGIILSLGAINAIEAVNYDTVTTSFSAGAAVGPYAGWMWHSTQLGASPEANALAIVPAGGTSPGAAYPPGWSSASKLSGLAAALWTLKYDPKGKVYAGGIPAPLYVLQGDMVYDPRLDSTFPGGSGACRATSEATWVYSENPYLHGLTWLIGRKQAGKRRMGVGMPVSGIDVAAYAEGASIADANGWKVGGVIRSTDDKWQVLKAILQAGSGEPIHVGAQVSCLINTPRTALATITTNDVIGDASVRATQPIRDRLNTIIPRYRSEAHNWEIIAASPVSVAAHVATDGETRSREIPYSYVQDLTQAAQLARYDIENAREFGPIVLPLKLKWMGYRPGDVVTVNLPEIGLNSVAMLVTGRELDPETGQVTLTGRSETAGKHAFALGQTTTAPPTPSVNVPPQVSQAATRNIITRDTVFPAESSAGDQFFDTSDNLDVPYVGGGTDVIYGGTIPVFGDDYLLWPIWLPVPHGDFTAQQQVSVSVNSLQSYDADYTGALIGSILPVSVLVTRGGASIKLDNDTSYAITNSPGIDVVIDNTNGSATKGDISPVNATTSLSASYATTDVIVTVAGVAQPKQTIVWSKTLGLVPMGTGGTGTKTVTDPYPTSLADSATSYTPITGELWLTLATGESLYGTAPLDYEITGSGGTGRTATAKWQYSAHGAGTWADFDGSPATGSPAVAGRYSSGEWIDPSLGFVSVSQSKSGLSAGDYDVRLVALQSASGRVMTFYGSATVQARV